MACDIESCVINTALVDDDEDTQQKFPRRRVAFEDTQQTALDEEDDEDEEPINLEDKKGNADITRHQYR